jgi:hypothetical protein
VIDLNIDMVIMKMLNEIIHNHDEVILSEKNRQMEEDEMIIYLEQNEMDKFHWLNSVK